MYAHPRIRGKLLAYSLADNVLICMLQEPAAQILKLSL